MWPFQFQPTKTKMGRRMSEASTVERNDVERNESRETEPDEEDDQVQAEVRLQRRPAVSSQTISRTY